MTNKGALTMRNSLAPLAVCLAAILVASPADAQPVTVNGDLTVNGEVVQDSTSAGAGAVFTKTSSGSTTSYAPALHGLNVGSYDTTASALNAIAVFGECNASISTGSHSLFCSGVYGYDDGASNATDRIAVRGVTSASSGVNITAGGFTNASAVNTYKWGVSGISVGDNGTKFGGYFGASGTGVNWALYTTTGDVALNVGGGNVYAFGALNVTSAIKTGGSAGPQWSAGTGSPESVVAAPVGSLFSRTDGGAGSTLYVKESGTGSVGWIAK